MNSTIQQSGGKSWLADAVPLTGTQLRWSAVFVCAVFCTQLVSATQSASELDALPNPGIAANYVSALASAAIPSKDTLNLRNRIVVSMIETGFLLGTTTAVHELGHASRVRAVGGHSNWETGDVNWWAYVSHRDPLAPGETEWQAPRDLSVEERISIAAAGFNATTTWDESVAGNGPFGLAPARFSTLLYEFAGITANADDLTQIEQLYRTKGYRVARRELQFWQLLAGGITQFDGSVRTYAYFTPHGVSLRAVTRWNGWSVATEAVVHGASAVEVEVGRRLCLGSKIELLPKVLVSAHGMGGSLKAEGRFRQTSFSANLQFVNRATLLGARATTSFELNVSTRL